MRHLSWLRLSRAVVAVLFLLWSIAVPIQGARAAAGNWTVFANAKLASWQAGFNIGSDTIVMVLVTSGYTPVTNTHATWADVSANEVSTGGGYTAGGQSVTASVSLSTGTVTFNLTAVTWSSATITAKYAVLVRRGSSSLVSGDKLLAYLDLNSGGGSVSSSSGNFTVSAPSGVFTQ
jgi:hypothetical protein